MTLHFERVRGKNGPAVEQAMRTWVDETPVESIEAMTTYRDGNGYRVYSILYWEADR